MPEIGAIVLAAGRSSRMEGGNKLLLPWKGSTMLQAVIANIMAAKPSSMVVVTNPVTHEYASDLGLKVIQNEDFEKGMTTSIQRGVMALQDADAYMICPADLTAITSEEYQRVMDIFRKRFEEDPMVIAVPFFNGMKGHPVIFSARYRDMILQHKEMEGCSGIVKANSQHVLRVDMETDHILRDIDDRKAYERHGQ